MFFYLQMIESDADQEKFTQLYACYRKRMFFTAYQILKNEFDADDAVHQAFLSVIENLHKVDPANGAQTHSYLSIITERKAIDILRARSMLSDAELDERFYAVEWNVPGELGLQKLIAQLSPSHREVMLLHYGCGYSIKEIAKMRNRKYDAVQKELLRARKELREKLEQEDLL